MITITTTAELEAFCTRAASHPYVTVDTEFLRERSYYSKLCLVQLAVPGDDKEDAVLVDPLVDGISLEPLYTLFRDENVVKVFPRGRHLKLEGEASRCRLRGLVYADDPRRAIATRFGRPAKCPSIHSEACHACDQQ